jgi:hypothetical protein
MRIRNRTWGREQSTGDLVQPFTSERNEFRESRRRDRLARTRPHAYVVDSNPAQKRFATGLLVDPWTRETLHAPASLDSALLCRDARLSPNSTVVVTNVLTQPLAAAWVLWVRKQCNVTTIVGTDSLFPNVLRTNRKWMRTLKPLMRFVPNFDFVPTSEGLLQAEIDSATDNLQWLEALEPSHILHFETTLRSFDPAVMSMSNYILFARRQSIATIRQLHNMTAHWQPQSRRPSVLHVTTSSPPESFNGHTFPLRDCDAAYPIEAVAYASLYNISVSSLKLPNLYGPLVTDYDDPLLGPNITTATDQPFIFVEDAAIAVTQALQSRPHLQLFTVSSSRTVPGLQLKQTLRSLPIGDDNHARETLTWKAHQEQPFFHDEGAEGARKFSRYSSDFVNTFGLGRDPLPCVSQCQSPLTDICASSVWDMITPMARNATDRCLYVAYVVSLSKELEELYEPEEVLDENALILCRVAFVSGKSHLVQTGVKEQIATKNNGNIPTDDELQKWNGKVQWNGWTVLWLPDHDETALTNTDYSLPVISPKMFWASSVSKAIYISSHEFAMVKDVYLVSIVRAIDRPATQAYTVKEYRPGTAIFRRLPKPAAPTRRVTLFAGEDAQAPQNALEFSELVESDLPATQIKYYSWTERFVQSAARMPSSDSRLASFPQFPYEWLTLTVLVHDLNMPASQEVRCAWLDEVLYWGGNRDSEELGLAHLIGTRKLWGHLGISGSEASDLGWLPLLDPNGEHQQHQSANVYLRVMQRQKTEPKATAVGPEDDDT